MSYSNAFLREFRPVFLGILKEKGLSAEKVAVIVIDEEPGGQGIFEPAGVKEVLEQISDDLNFLTIYTERPAYFYEFAETMYEENGLIIEIFSKIACKRLFRREEIRVCDSVACAGTFIMDFEWEGACYTECICPGKYYVPIHKKPWKKGENLDIIVPIGYNTEIVKGIQNKRKKPRRDRLEEAFYS